MTKELEEKRREIDEIDKEIINLIDKRFSIVSEVIKIKKDLGLEIFDSKREEKVLKKVEKNSRNYKYVKEIFKTMMEESKKFQKNEK